MSPLVTDWGEVRPPVKVAGRLPFARGPLTVIVLALLTVALLTITVSTPVSAKASAPVRPPGAPRAVKAIGVNTAIGVSWRAPARTGDEGGLRYVVTVSTTVEPCVFTANTACTVSGLTNGKSYSVSVQAVNSQGEGVASRKVKVTPTSAQDCSYLDPYANLQGCTLNGLDLIGGNLTGANLTAADLSDANLGGANLTDVDLSGADLAGANLSCVRIAAEMNQLICAELSGSDLNDTDLSGASLSGVSSGGIAGMPSVLPSPWSLVAGYLLGPGANLSAASLSNTDLVGVDLIGANLADADLSGATLSDADLSGASLTGATLTSVIWSDTTCPDGTNSDNDGDTCIRNLG